MVTITTINATDLVSDSRAVINTNFANLNAAISGGGGGGVTFYNEDVTGTIDGVNADFTVPTTIATALVLVLANSIQRPGVDFTTVGSTITYAVAPDSSLSGQPHWIIHT